MQSPEGLENTPLNSKFNTYRHKIKVLIKAKAQQNCCNQVLYTVMVFNIIIKILFKSQGVTAGNYNY